MQVGDAADRRGGFGEQLCRDRAAAGLTQEELAERSGLSVRAISDMECGRTSRPRHSTLRQIGTATASTLARPNLAAPRSRSRATPRRWPGWTPSTRTWWPPCARPSGRVSTSWPGSCRLCWRRCSSSAAMQTTGSPPTRSGWPARGCWATPAPCAGCSTTWDAPTSTRSARKPRSTATASASRSCARPVIGRRLR